MPESRKKICLFIHSLNGGGAERVFINLANQFSVKNYQVTLLIMKSDGVYTDFVPPQVKVVNIGTGTFKYFKTIQVIPALVSYLRDSRPEALLSAFSTNNIIAIIAVWLARTRTTLIVTEHSNFSWLESLSFFKRQIISLCIRILYRYASQIVAVSEGLANELQEDFKVPKEKISVVYNPINIDEILVSAEDKPSQVIFDIGKTYIIAVGRLTKQKNFSLLISAFYEVHKQHKNLHLLLLGEGEERKKLESLVSELGIKAYVHMPGFVANPFYYISNAKMLVLSSNYEGFGNVLVEAFACGTPVVSTDCPHGPSEVLQNGKLGTLVEVGNLSQMVCAITNQLNISLNRIDLVGEAEQYSSYKIAEKYLKIIGK